MTRRTDGDATGWVEPGCPPARPRSVTRIHAVVPAAALGLVLLLSACAERGGAGAAPAPTEPTATAALPDDGGVLVLQVAATGGFVTPEMLAGRLPVISVYADGRVISEGPVATIYPGYAWPNVQLQQTDRATVQTLVDHALAAGVTETTDLGRPGIADATSTRFTLTTAAGTTVREVYALTEGAGSPSGFTDEQRAARTRLTGLLTELTDLPVSLDAEGEAPAAYEPTAVAALVRPWTVPEGDASLGEQPELPWPGPALSGEPVAPQVTCVVATGDQAAAVADAARGANQLTPWSTADGARWSISFRPLLPHETGCADLTR
ncbi:MAG: uncharacterized protein JWP68_3643 [Modestobacter sp.]|nr:uncharacterized protein [Modestobacter sp.]